MHQNVHVLGKRTDHDFNMFKRHSSFSQSQNMPYLDLHVIA